MSDLVEFLRAWLDKDERIARAAGGPVWRSEQVRDDPDGRPGGYALTLGDDRPIVDIGFMDDDEMRPAEAEHIARWNPARVLAEVEAKRRIIDEHRHGPPSEDGAADDVTFGCYTCRVGRDGWMWIDGWCPTLRLLALPYVDHPDYDEAWRP